MAIALVQIKTAAATSLTLNSATTAGNCLVVGFTDEVGASSVTAVKLGGVADNFAQLTSAAGAPGKAGEVLAVLWADPSCAGGQTAVAVTAAGSAHPTMWAAEFSGIVASSPLDKQTGATSASSGFSSGSTATTTQAVELWLGAACLGTASATGPSAPWNNTNVSDSSGDSQVYGYQIVSSTGSAIYSGSGGTTGGSAAVVATLKGASSGPSGTVQPRATVPVPRRRPARATWQRITGQGVAQVPAPVQQSATVPRRRRLRALIRFVPVATTNAIPPPPVAGTVQPQTAIPAPRRKPARAWLRSTPVTTTNAIPSVPGTVQPQTAQPAPRRRRLRAAVRFTPVATTNAHGGSGTVQRRPTVPVPRRQRQRGIWHGIAAPFLPVRVAAPRQEYQTPPRRRRARASVRFTPVATTNAIGPQTLIISLAAQAGVDDYGNHFPQGILVNQGVIEGNIISSQSIPKGTLATGAVDDFTINAATINAGTITAADILISGTAGGQFAYSSGGTITQIFTSAGSWTIPAGVTAYQLEGWAGGGGGGGTNSGLDAGAGGGGAEYVKYNAVAGTPGATVNFTVGAAGLGNSGTGNGTSGGNGIWDTGGSPKTVHGGSGGNSAAHFALGGSGGTGNTDADVHHNGGSGGSSTPVGVNLAGGGGGSAGPTFNGVSANNGDNSGAPAVPDGGPGGNGDSAPVTGPGGGGGGYLSFGGGDGQPGQWKVTYTSSSPQLIASIAGAATTDPVVGGAVPEGVASDHVSVTTTGSTPSTPSGLCVLYYDGTHLKAVGPSGVPVTIATT